MPMHPYPVELVSQVCARNGEPVVIRPIRPEDAELERAFFDSLSDESRYQRFFYRMNELTPSMLARFTHVDYDRELALVAVVVEARDAASTAFIGVARYVMSEERDCAEYAIVVHDDWRRQGIGRTLMERLIVAAKRKGLRRLEGAVLRENATMLAFAASLGFSTQDNPGDSQQTLTMLELTTGQDTMRG